MSTIRWEQQAAQGKAKIVCAIAPPLWLHSSLDPQSACIAAIKRIASTDPLGLNLEIYFIALDKRGNYGAAGAGKGFQYAVTTPEDSQVFQSEAVGGGTVGPEGGNR